MERKYTDISAKLAEEFETFDLDDVPESTKKRAKLITLDSIGISVYGSHRKYISNVLECSNKYGLKTGDDNGAIAYATFDKHPPILSAEANATAASSTECYSGLQGAGMGSIYVVSTAVSFGEYFDLTGRSVLESIIVGYEVAAIVGDLLRPYSGDLQGHGGNMPVGVAATIASLLEFDSDSFAHALRIAANPLLIGSWGSILQGATVRNYYSGLSISHGVRAAILAESGISGMENAIKNHLFENLSLNQPDDETIEATTGRFGDSYYLDETIFKMHPSCRYTHAPLEAIKTICSENNIESEDIDSVIVYTSEFATYGDIVRPESAVDAKYSIPYVLGAFLARGSTDVTEYRRDAINDEEILTQSEKVSVRADPEYDARAGNGIWGAAVEVVTVDKENFRVDVYDAESGVDVSEKEIVEKFNKMLRHRDGPFDTEQLQNNCLNLEELDSVRHIYDY